MALEAGEGNGGSCKDGKGSGAASSGGGGHGALNGGDGNAPGGGARLNRREKIPNWLYLRLFGVMAHWGMRIKMLNISGQNIGR
jgi:hypothetical protein